MSRRDTHSTQWEPTANDTCTLNTTLNSTTRTGTCTLAGDLTPGDSIETTWELTTSPAQVDDTVYPIVLRVSGQGTETPMNLSIGMNKYQAEFDENGYVEEEDVFGAKYHRSR